MSGQQRGHHIHRVRQRDVPVHLEQPDLLLERQPVAALGLDGGDAVAHETVEPFAGQGAQHVVGGLAGGLDRAGDAAARLLHLLVGGPGHAHLELVGPVSSPGQVAVALDQARHDHPAVGVEHLAAAHQAHFFHQRGLGAHPDDAALARGHGPVADAAHGQAAVRIPGIAPCR